MARTRLRRAFVLVIAMVTLFPQTAHAATPYPAFGSNDPYAYHTYAFLADGERPNENVDGRLEYSCLPSGNPLVDGNPQELFGIMGPCTTEAWETTTGRPDVTIAVLDSGIIWPRHANDTDLARKTFINRGELPVPQGGPNEDDRRFGGYDVDRNGMFNVDDYANDSRLEDRNNNSVRDPEDLILDPEFANGVDNDNNGYVDDIAGWDFFENDNNPRDEPQYGHGTGEARDSTAEANNSSQGDMVGVCPNCMSMQMRVGDSFVADVHHFAEAVTYATDNGADIVQEALGTLNNSRFGQQAVDYAWKRGVLIVASAADEEAAHHNYPSNYGRTMVVNAVMDNDLQQPKSFLNLDGCTNFGGKMHVSVPGEQCSSEATGMSSGMAGLVYSAALNEVDRGTMTRYPLGNGQFAPYPISPNELKQIFRARADDIDFSTPAAPDPAKNFPGAPPNNYASTEAPPAERYHSVEGWDQFFGYGRVNAEKMVELVDGTTLANPTIPPEAEITGPTWFETTPTTKNIDILGRVAANRASSYTFKVQWAAGVQPPEFPLSDTWHDLAPTKTGTQTAPVVGKLATLDVAAVQQAITLREGWQVDPAREPTSRSMPERYAYRLRVQVIDNRGQLGEDQRQLFAHDDPDLVAGFPKQLGADGASSPVFADINDDGDQELILGTSNGEVHAFRADGSELPGWPVGTDPAPVMTHASSPALRSGEITTPIRGAILAGSPGVADLDQDGDVEIVASDLEGKVYAWEHDGKRHAGFPVSVDRRFSQETSEGAIRNQHNRRDWGINSAPAIGDLDGNDGGKLEVVFGANDSHVYAFNDDGTKTAGWPVLLRDPSKVQSVDPVTHKITFRGDSGVAIGTKILPPPTLGDLDNDGDLEVVVGVNEEYREDPNFSMNSAVIKAVLEVNDQLPDRLLEPGNGRVYALDHRGTLAPQSGDAFPAFPDEQAYVPGWPFKAGIVMTELLPYVGTGINGAPPIANVDDDPELEVALFSFAGPAYVVNHDGTSIYGKDPEGHDISLTTDRDAFGAASNGTDAPAIPALGTGIFTDMTGTGVGFAAPGAGLMRLLDVALPNHQVGAQDYQMVWDLNAPGGTMLPGFPHEVNDLQFFAGPSSADITGDGLPELLGGTAVYDVAAPNALGVEALGWPKFTGGWTVSVPAVGDLNGDGSREVASVTREGNLYVWNTDADACGTADWPKAQHDLWNTSNYATDATRPGAINDLRVQTPTPDATDILLTWTAPGEDEVCGNATRYEVRSSKHPLTAANWSSANEVTGEPTPKAPGSAEAATLKIGVRDRYVAIRTFDDAGNGSAISNVELLPRVTPNARIGDANSSEGHSGTKSFRFDVTLDEAAGADITMRYATRTNTAGSRDFVPVSGTLTFAPGETKKSIIVKVRGDRTYEAIETFFVELSDADGATLVDRRGVGTIRNDDPKPRPKKR